MRFTILTAWRWEYGCLDKWGPSSSFYRMPWQRGKIWLIWSRLLLPCKSRYHEGSVILLNSNWMSCSADVCNSQSGIVSTLHKGKAYLIKWILSRGGYAKCSWSFCRDDIDSRCRCANVSHVHFRDFLLRLVFCLFVCRYLTFTIKQPQGRIPSRAPQRIREACWGIQPAGLNWGIILGWNAQWKERGQEADTSQCSVAISTINPIAMQGPHCQLFCHNQDFLFFSPFVVVSFKVWCYFFIFFFLL